MRYIPGFKFTIVGTQSGANVNKGNLFNQTKVKTFIKSPIEGLELNRQYELSHIKPIYEDKKVVKVKYVFTRMVPGVARYRKEIIFDSIKDAEAVFDLITNTKEEAPSEERSMSLKDRLANKPRLNLSNVRGRTGR